MPASSRAASKRLLWKKPTISNPRAAATSALRVYVRNRYTDESPSMTARGRRHFRSRWG